LYLGGYNEIEKSIESIGYNLRTTYRVFVSGVRTGWIFLWWDKL